MFLNPAFKANLYRSSPIFKHQIIFIMRRNTQCDTCILSLPDCNIECPGNIQSRNPLSLETGNFHLFLGYAHTDRPPAYE